MANEEKRPTEKKPEDSFPFQTKVPSDLPWSLFLGKKNFSSGVLMFSAYFKKLGMPQTLSHGDWYYVNIGTDEAPSYVVNLYKKNNEKEEFTFDDMKFLSSNKYVKIPSLQELITIILMCTYNFSYEGGIVINPEAPEVSVKLYSDALNNELVVRGRDLHEAVIQAAYECYLIGRNLNGFSIDSANGWVLPMTEDEDEDA